MLLLLQSSALVDRYTGNRFWFEKLVDNSLRIGLSCFLKSVCSWKTVFKFALGVDVHSGFPLDSSKMSQMTFPEFTICRINVLFSRHLGPREIPDRIAVSIPKL